MSSCGWALDGRGLIAASWLGSFMIANEAVRREAVVVKISGMD